MTDAWTSVPTKDFVWLGLKHLHWRKLQKLSQIQCNLTIDCFDQGESSEIIFMSFENLKARLKDGKS